jgi:hypothetical protein
MAYETYEISKYDGAPIELLLFKDDVAQQTWAFTTGDDAIVDGLVTYLPDVIERTSVKQSGAKAPDGIQVKVPSDSNLARQFVAYLPVRPVALIAQRLQRNDGTLERVTFFTGAAVTVGFEPDGMATINCQPAMKSIGRKVPWQVYKSGCNWALYEEGCGVLRSLFATVAEGYTTSGLTVVSGSFLSHPDGWFNNGYIEAGLTGERRYIVGHVGNTLTLNYPFFNLAPDAVLTAYAGCQRDKATCAGKFNNLDRKLGFDFVPELNPYETNFGTQDAGSSSSSTTNWRKMINPAGWDGSWGFIKW